MVAIVVLTIAIIPMISMFDMSLKVATKGSDYDKARALANLKLEEAKSLTFDTSDNTVQDLKDNFPLAAGNTTSYDLNSNSRYLSDPPLTQAGFPNFQYIIEKQYMKQPSPSPAATEDFYPCTPANACTPPTSLIRVTVTVQWGNGNTYTTYGLRAE